MQWHAHFETEALRFDTKAQLLKQLLQQKEHLRWPYLGPSLAGFHNMLCYKGHAHQLYNFKLPKNGLKLVSQS